MATTKTRAKPAAKPRGKAKPEAKLKFKLTYDDLTHEQISIYAKELNDYFRKERELRESLEERDDELSQRAREVAALNQMLQQHLLEWYQIAQDYREVLRAIKEMLKTAQVSPTKGALIQEFIDSAISTRLEPEAMW
ncbi:MAG: hypothetical protein V3S98_11245, partial [Dehalococcoidia bacterium]